MNLTIAGVYLLHFNKTVTYEFAKNFGDDLHYFGASNNIMNRIEQHQNNEGSAMTKHELTKGNDFIVAAIYPGDTFGMERALVKTGAKKLCPICQRDDYLWNRHLTGADQGLLSEFGYDPFNVPGKMTRQNKTQPAMPQTTNLNNKVSTHAIKCYYCLKTIIKGSEYHVMNGYNLHLKCSPKDVKQMKNKRKR